MFVREKIGVLGPSRTLVHVYNIYCGLIVYIYVRVFSLFVFMLKLLFYILDGRENQHA